MEAVRSPPSPTLEREDSAPPSYFDIIDSAPPPPTHSIHILSNDNEDLVRQITSQGISDEWARIALRRCNGNVNDAIRLCFESGALESPTQPMRPTTKKKKGNVVTRTLGALKRSSNKPERGNVQEDHSLSRQREQISRVEPPISRHQHLPQHEVPLEPPPSYDHVVVVCTSSEVLSSNDLADLPSYEDIVGPPPSSLVDVDSLEPKLLVALENSTSREPFVVEPDERSNSLPTIGQPTSETPPNSESSKPSLSPKVLVPPLLLSQTQNKSWRGWKQTECSGEISPIYVPVSGDYTSDYSDVVVEDMRKPSQEADDMVSREQLIENTPLQEVDTNILNTIAQYTPRASEEQELNSPRSNMLSQRVHSFEDVVSSEDEANEENTESDVEEIIDFVPHSARVSTPICNMQTLIDRNENTEEDLPSIISRGEFENEDIVRSSNDESIIYDDSQNFSIRNEFEDSEQELLNTPINSMNIVECISSGGTLSVAVAVAESDDELVPLEAHSVEIPTPQVIELRDTTPSNQQNQVTQNLSSAVVSPSNPESLQAPSQVILENRLLPPRPISMSRLPRATAVEDDTMDDDTVHGEAYVQVSLSSVAAGTAVADLYLRDESGGLYMAVAAPLSGPDDDNPHTTDTMISNEEENSNQNRGIFSYARNRLYGEHGSSRRDIEGGVRRRVFLPFDIEEREGKFFPVLYLTQPKLGSNNGPQHNRPTMLRMSPSSNRNLSVRHAEVNTPPLWDGGADRKECSICLHTAGILYKIHHCRNCGHYVCNNCSKKDWPASMLPKTYVPEKESIVRVCDNCSYLQETFIDSLRSGDLNRSMVFYLTGNVNLHCPMTIYKSEEFPIHTAIQGGNIHLVRWLIEDRRCSLRDADGEPLKTAEGLSPLAVAAFYGHREIMQYLVQQQGSRVSEIKDLTILLRGLHASLEAPGELPDVEPQSSLGSLFGRRALPGELEPLPSRSVGTSAPVPAQLATGNRNITHIPTTIAEAAPEYSVSEATSRPKLSTGKRRSISQASVAQTRRTLAESSRIMQTTMPETESSPGRRDSSVSDYQRAIPTPYTDDDISVMTADMIGQFRGLSPRNIQNIQSERSTGHRRSRSLHSATSTAIAVSSNMSPTSSADSLDRTPRNPSPDTPRQISRYEVNSANLSRAATDDDNESVDTLMTATNHTIDPVEANRMSVRATSQSYARLEAEEREAQRILSRAASSARQLR